MTSNHECSNCTHTKATGLEQTLDEIKFENSIFNACVYGDIDKVKQLINKNGRSVINEQDKNGYSCLHYASRNGHLNICKLLIEAGIDVNLKTFSCKSTALHRASFIGNKDIVKLLLDSKANPEEKDCDGKTALHKCVEQFNIKKTNPAESRKYIETINVLLKNNNNILKIADNHAKSPIDYCPDLFDYLN